MNLDKAFGIIAVLACSALLVFLGWATVGAVRSNGNTDYCFVEMVSPTQMAPQYQVWGHRPWRTDRMIGAYPTLEEAKAKADVMGCKLNAN